MNEDEGTEETKDSDPDVGEDDQDPDLASPRLYGVPVTESHGQVVLHTDKNGYNDLVGALVDDGFGVCIDLCGADYLGNETRVLPEEITPERFRLPVVQKSRRDGYDGRGVQVIDEVDDLANAFDVPSVVEEKVDIAQEISVIVARSPSGEVRTFPTVEMVVSDVSNMLDYLLSPARLSPSIERQCIEVAESLATALDLVGLLAVELFVSQDGQVLINEIAPRPHNSGHHSIEANVTSQFEQHVRAVCDMPLGDTALKSPAVMVNLVGAEGYQGPVRYEGFNRVLAMPDVYIHLYGKAETRPFRKMGHVTIVRPNVSEAIEIAQQIKEEMQVIA